MTQQHHPDGPARAPTGHSSGTRGFGVIPVIAGVLLLVIFGVMMLGPDNDTRKSNVRTNDAPGGSPTTAPNK